MKMVSIMMMMMTSMMMMMMMMMMMTIMMMMMMIMMMMQEERGVCLSPGCVTVAADIIKSADFSADPCEAGEYVAKSLEE